MITLNEKQLKMIMPFASICNIRKYLPEFNKVMLQFDINTPLRVAHFIAQVAHESGSLSYVKELASGAAYDTGNKAISLGNTPQADGDGQLYKGRGLIQCTGRNNYMAFKKWLGGAPDVVAHPELLEQPHLAMLVSCWFWKINGLNALADKNDFLSITKRINGGTNGINERCQFLNIAKSVIK
ncbi:hypothetical protein [uncultured Bacteroides sp.]|uniref:glycoside hydrolase family 19 protein n=1 Tax=uncultured Bacteroides sp. TaxID=162156 RepID=UPI002AABCFF1|nr:hypothetical protein [uncultured Bacteroides sp.]